MKSYHCFSLHFQGNPTSFSKKLPLPQYNDTGLNSTDHVHSFNGQCSNDAKMLKFRCVTMRLHHREHKCKHYTWVWVFQLNYSTNPSFFFSQTRLLLFFFIKAHTIKYVHREVRNIWKHLKKVHTRLRISWVCWRHHCYSAGNVSSHLSAYQCSIPDCITEHPELENTCGIWGHSGLVQDTVVFKTTAALGNRVFQIPLKYLELFSLLFFITIIIQSLMLPFVPEHQTKISTLMFPPNRNCRATNKLSKKSEDDWNNQLSPS